MSASVGEALWGKPYPLVLSGPSGAGKSTLARELLAGVPGTWLSVSATTRAPRPEEVEGEDYLFLSVEDFHRRRERGDLAEWAEVHGQGYGTPREALEECLARGKLPILDIDVQGGLQVRGLYPLAVLVFILPPSLAVLEERLRDRRSETGREREKRLSNAQKEMEYLWEYDYLVINDVIPQAVSHLEDILRAEARRVVRLPRGVAWEEILRRQHGLF